MSVSLIEQLHHHKPYDSREEESLRQMIDFIDKVDDPFTREDAHHITASAFVISRYGLALHFHKKFHMWIQPGGHCDPGEIPYETVQREAYEEIGLCPEFIPEIFHVDVHEAGPHLHFDIRYLAHSETTHFSPGENETRAVAWFAPAALATIEDPALKGALSKLSSEI